jgi:SNF2 family DNA or RNA helicase
MLSLCPGYGKCRVSLLALPSDVGNVVIVCPPVVLLHWPEEVKKWRPDLGHVQVLKTAKTPINLKCKVFVVPYGVLTNRMKPGGLGMPEPDAMIVDEFHMIKTPYFKRRGKVKGQRTRATLKLLKDARHRYLIGHQS